MLGTSELFDYLDKYSIDLDPSFEMVLGKHVKKTWNIFVTEDNQDRVAKDALDLLSRMLVYDHVTSDFHTLLTSLFWYRLSAFYRKTQFFIPTLLQSLNITIKTLRNKSFLYIFLMSREPFLLHMCTQPCENYEIAAPVYSTK